MKYKSNKPKGSESFPFFVNSSPYYYRVTYLDTRRRASTLVYNSPHELILSLRMFQPDDKITYITRKDDQDLITVTVDGFKLTIAQSLYQVSQDVLELLYLRLLLTNRYSKSIADRGHFLQYDFTFRKYLITLRGGIDSYLTYENKKVILYFKYRRLSSIHLRAVIMDWNEQNDIQLNQINMPQMVANQELLYEALRLDLRKDQIKVFNYNPVDEDNIQPTNILREIIQVINQLIK